jgi:hypothetical protein
MLFPIGTGMPHRRRPSVEREAWKPRLARGGDRGEHVPKRFRRLRLRRRGRARMAGDSVTEWIAIAAVLAAVAFLASRAF